MNTQTYYVIKPTTHQRKKMRLGDPLSLTESQARPLHNGGFITADKIAAARIMELTFENEALKTNEEKTTPTKKPEKPHGHH